MIKGTYCHGTLAVWRNFNLASTIGYEKCCWEFKNDCKHLRYGTIS